MNQNDFLRVHQTVQVVEAHKFTKRIKARFFIHQKQQAAVKAAERRRDLLSRADSCSRQQLTRCSPALLDDLLSRLSDPQLDTIWSHIAELLLTSFCSPIPRRLSEGVCRQIWQRSVETMRNPYVCTLLSGVQSIVLGSDENLRSSIILAKCSQLRSLTFTHDLLSSNYDILALSSHTEELLGRHLISFKHRITPQAGQNFVDNLYLYFFLYYPSLNKIIRFAVGRLRHLSLQMPYVLTRYPIPPYECFTQLLGQMSRLESLELFIACPENLQTFQQQMRPSFEAQYTRLTSLSLKINLHQVYRLFSGWLQPTTFLKSLERLSLTIGEFLPGAPLDSSFLRYVFDILIGQVTQAGPILRGLKFFALDLGMLAAQKPNVHFDVFIKIFLPFLDNLTTLYLRVHPDNLADRMLPLNFQHLSSLKTLKYYCPVYPTIEPIDALFMKTSKKRQTICPSCQSLTLSDMPDFTSITLSDIWYIFPRLKQLHIKAFGPESYESLHERNLELLIQQLPRLRTLRFLDDHRKRFRFETIVDLLRQRAAQLPEDSQQYIELRIPLNDNNLDTERALVVRFGALEHLDKRLRIH